MSTAIEDALAMKKKAIAGKVALIATVISGAIGGTAAVSGAHSAADGGDKTIQSLSATTGDKADDTKDKTKFGDVVKLK